MAKIIATAFAALGFATLLVVVTRFYRPKIIPPKSDLAILSILGGRLAAPVAGVLGSAWLIVGFIMFAYADSRDTTHIVEVTAKELELSRSTVDSLTGVIADLEVQLSAVPRDSTSAFILNLRFGLGTPLPSLGDGIEAVLRGTSDASVDVLEIAGVNGLSFSLEADFEPVMDFASFDYRNRRHVFVQLDNGSVWGIAYIGLNKGTGLNRFRFFRVR